MRVLESVFFVAHPIRRRTNWQYQARIRNSGFGSIA